MDSRGRFRTKIGSGPSRKTLNNPIWTSRFVLKQSMKMKTGMREDRRNKNIISTLKKTTEMRFLQTKTKSSSSLPKASPLMRKRRWRTINSRSDGISSRASTRKESKLCRGSRDRSKTRREKTSYKGLRSNDRSRSNKKRPNNRNTVNFWRTSKNNRSGRGNRSTSSKYLKNSMSNAFWYISINLEILRLDSSAQSQSFKKEARVIFISNPPSHSLSSQRNYIHQ